MAGKFINFIKKLLRWGPQKGGLVSDISPDEMTGGGLYVTIPESGGLNIRSVGDGTNVTPDYEDILGNEYVYEPAAATLSNRIFRFYIVYTLGAKYVFKVSDPQASQQTGLIDAGANLTDTYTNIVAALGTLTYTITTTALTATSATEGYFDAEVTDVPYWNYLIESLGIENGREYVVNGTFTGSASTWTLGSGWTYGSNKITHTTPSSTNAAYQDLFGIENNQYVYFSVTTSDRTFGIVQVRLGTNLILSSGTNTTTSFGFNANTLTGLRLSFNNPSGPWNGSIDDVSLFSPLLMRVEIIQDAIDPSTAGDWRNIGNNDQLGDEFSFWTTRVGLPETIPIASIVDGGGFYRVIMSTTYNWGQNFAVQINGTGTTADGTWIIDVVDAITFDLLGSVFGATSATGTATSYIYGLGEIGVGVKDENDQSWTYTTLLRAKEFNFSTLKQIDCRAKRKQDSNIAIYFTDDFNDPRVFYYKGAYTTNGALQVNGGNYNYNTLVSELKWILAVTGFNLSFLNQIQAGGKLLSGNWRYAVRFLTTNLTSTGWSELTNPVNVYLVSSSDDPYTIVGDEENKLTGKQNVLKLTIPVDGIFAYAEIAAINYLDSSLTAQVIGRYLLTGGDQEIVHTGLETDVTDFDAGELNQVLAYYRTARNVELIDNRAVLSNLTLQSIVDFTAFAQTITHSVKKQTIQGCEQNGTDPLVFGEYMDFQNVYKYTGYMINETYRFGIRPVFKNGFVSSVAFHVQDIKINTDAGYPRRVAALSDYDLTNAAMSETYVPYVELSNFDFDYIIDGLRLRDFVAYFQIERAECVNEVLAYGYGVPSVLGFTSDTTAGPPAQQIFYSDTATNPTRYGEYPYISGRFATWVGNYPTVNPAYPAEFGSTVDSSFDRTVISFVAPDIRYGVAGFSFVSGDVILNFGPPQQAVAITVGTNAVRDVYSWQGHTFAVYTGRTTVSTVATHIISEMTEIATNTGGTIAGNTFDKRWWMTAAPTTPLVSPDVSWTNRTSYVIKLTTGITARTAYTEYGVHLMQYYRAIGTTNGVVATKYGDPLNTKYISTEASISDTGSVSVFGGDTFTQKTFLKHRLMNVGPLDDIGGGLDYMQGFSGEISYYTQNRANTQMANLPTPITVIYPHNHDLETWLDSLSGVSMNYNKGYNIRNEIISIPAYDPSAEYQTDWRNAIAWSDPEAEGSVTDALRQFLPLNIKFMDYTYGYISGAMNVNDELIVVQQTKTTFQYFNSTGLLTTKEGAEVILGDGGILKQKGRVLTTYGTSHKWSILIGKNNRGNAVLYFVDTENKVIVRYGYNGAEVISDLQGMKAFCSNNFTYLINKDTPAHEQGIHGVPNNRFREIIWTFRGWKEGIDEWTPSGYVVGAVVSYLTQEFEQLPAFYELTEEDHTFDPPAINPSWTLIKYTDKRYYNVFTLVYNEIKDVFQAFYTPKPLIYAKYKDHYLVPRPVSNSGQMYENNRGTWLRWFDDGDTAQVASAYFDAAFNEPRDLKKTFSTIRYISDIAPARAEVTTRDHFTYITEFETREGQHDCTIPNDTLTSPTGVNSDDTSKMWGSYAIIRTIISTGTYNKISSLLTLIRPRARKP